MTDADIIKQVQDIDKRLVAVASKKQQLLGEQQAIRTRLKDEFGVTSTAKAQAKVAEMEAQIAEDRNTLTKFITDTTVKLEEVENALG